VAFEDARVIGRASAAALYAGMTELREWDRETAGILPYRCPAAAAWRIEAALASETRLSAREAFSFGLLTREP
jgi:hypothetical protein